MKNKGITLIALVITIIVLLILAGISLSLTLGKNGILTKAREARIAQRDAEIEEELKMAYAAFKTAQASKEIQEPNVYKAQVDYVKTKMEEKYGNKLKEVYKSGKYTKAEFKNNDTVYVLKHDGSTYHYTLMKKTTNIFGRLDSDEKILYLRAKKIDGYIGAGSWLNGNVSSEDNLNINKIVIEEPIVPTTGNHLFENLDNLKVIENIENLHTENIKVFDCMFYNCKNLNNLDVSRFDTREGTSFQRTFENCEKLTKLEIEGFDMQKVSKMNWTFQGCKALRFLDVSGFDTPNIDQMTNLFLNCTSLKNLDISCFDTTNVTSMSGVFSGCSSLESINLNGIKTNNVNRIGSMFQNCSKLTNIDISTFDTSNVTYIYGMMNVFSGCKSLKNLNLGSCFVINEGTNYNVIMDYQVPLSIKIICNQDTADKIKTSNTGLTGLNFEIIE